MYIINIPNITININIIINNIYFHYKMTSPMIELAKVASNALSGKAAFTDVSQMDVGQTLLAIVIFLILLTFIMWVGAYIFNHSLVKVFPSVNKISVGNFLGLYIVIHILFC